MTTQIDAPQSRGASLEDEMHYKRMYDDKEFLYAFDLDGREVTVQIENCTAGQITGEQGRKSKKPMLAFVGKKKKLALNKTNGKTIAALYGPETNNWDKKWVTLYPTTTTFGSETVECIRVRPVVPQPPDGAGKQRNARRGSDEGKAAAQEGIDAAGDDVDADESPGGAETNA